jgi:hypothetical protein
LHCESIWRDGVGATWYRCAVQVGPARTGGR